MRALARWTWRIATAWLCYLILVSCGPRPGHYEWELEPPAIAEQLDHCARALTVGGETAQLCTTSRDLCVHGVWLARQFGHIASGEMRLAKVSECRPLAKIHEQRTEIR